MLIINPAIQFMTYEAIKRRICMSLNNSQPSAWVFFVIGAVAKAIATVLTYPLQLVQTKLRVRIIIFIFILNINHYFINFYIIHTIWFLILARSQISKSTTKRWHFRNPVLHIKVSKILLNIYIFIFNVIFEFLFAESKE